MWYNLGMVEGNYLLKDDPICPEVYLHDKDTGNLIAVYCRTPMGGWFLSSVPNSEFGIFDEDATISPEYCSELESVLQSLREAKTRTLQPGEMTD
jgi:hypothetical protein